MLTTFVAALVLLGARLHLPRQSAIKGLIAGGLTGAALVALFAGPLTPTPATLGVAMALAIAVLIATLRRDLGAAGIAAALAVVACLPFLPDTALFRDRSFFGTHQVIEYDGMRIYSNGTTIHGAERLTDFASTRPEPLYYYHKNGPMARS